VIVMNRSVFRRDPKESSLANNGQARLEDRATEGERAVLREELSTFVCEGEYAEGLARILDTYLRHLGGTTQPCAWVSGFYGSGKSHLLKMLTHLWANTEFAEVGLTARNLVPSLPRDLAAMLRELDTQGRRLGGLHAAAGTLPQGDSRGVRLAVLGIVLRSLDMPDSYAQARFCLHLRRNGFYTAVAAKVAAKGRNFAKELNDLYVSPVLHDALVEVDAGFTDRRAARDAIRQQFPQRDDITTTEFLGMLREVIGVEGRLPCVLLALDEVQLYIGDSQERAAQVIEVAEVLSKQLDARLLVVGAGQDALTATALLQKLMDRFTVQVHLSDTDVESVVRKVLLEKKPDCIALVEAQLDGSSGEIARHLQGTAIAPRPEDQQVLVADYPILPVRRRLWEQALRGLDPSGTKGLLRSQLKLVQEALRRVAERTVGTVIAADFLFDNLRPELLQQGVLLAELHHRLQELEREGEEGRLLARICGLVFLLRRLPRDGSQDLGIRATAGVLADLLVEDLANDGARLRSAMPDLLRKLVEEKRLLVETGGEYMLQTRESADWDREFRERQSKLSNQADEIQRKRANRFATAVNEAVRSVRLYQGVAKEARKLALHFGEELPPISGAEIPVWVRDEWSVTLKDFIDAARREGTSSPVAFVFVQKVQAATLNTKIADAEAARSTLDLKGTPSNPEGIEARNAMKSRLDTAEASLNQLVRGLVGAARVVQGGGSEVHGSSLEEKLREAGTNSLDRLFPRFRDADHRAWRLAYDRARAGVDAPLQAVDWTGPTEQHPVAREVLAAIGSGCDGRKLRKKFSESPFGWPQDALDAVLVALHASGHLLARYKGTTLAAGQLDQTKIPATELRIQMATITAQEKIRLRQLCQKAGLQVTPTDDLAAKSEEFLRELRQRAKSAGGPRPLPPEPTVPEADELEGLAGNERLKRLLVLAPKLESSLDRWEAAATRIAERLPTWQRLEVLLRHGESLPSLADARQQAEAIRTERRLLDEPDLVAPLDRQVANALRTDALVAHRRWRSVLDHEAALLEEADAWQRLPESDRDQLRSEFRLTPLGEPTLANEDDLIGELTARPLASRPERIEALPTRFAQALERAARLLEPSVHSVKLSSGTLRTDKDIAAWLQQVERRLLEELSKGPIVVG
jgi:hypothetical protein